MNTNILRVIAILLFIGAIFFGWYGYQISKPQPVSLPTPQVTTVPQVVASRAITAGEMLKASDLSVKQVSRFNNAGFNSPQEVIGHIVNSNIESGAPLLTTNLMQLGPAAALLKSGERAVAIKVDEVAGVGGFIKPGDYVDVLLFAHDDRDAKRHSMAQVVLSGLRVISYGEEIQSEDKSNDASGDNDARSASSIKNPLEDNQSKTKAGTARSAVLVVKDADTTKLMLAASIGQLRLALRGEEPTQVATDSNMVAHANQAPTHFMRSDELLQGGVESKPPEIKRPANISSTGSGKAGSTSKAKPSVVIVHYGDKTEKVVVKGAK
jgi:pilus assembly protein CpaB